MKNPKVMENQKAYCRVNGEPEFAPTNTGKCYSCGVDLTEHITEEKASTELIIGCPVCHHSYCD